MSPCYLPIAKSLFYLSCCCLSTASLSHHDIRFLSLSFKNRPDANLCHQATDRRGSQPHRPRHEKDFYSFFTRPISLKRILNPETSAAVCRWCWRECANVSVSPGLYILYIIQPFTLTLSTQDNRSACIITVRTPEQAAALNLCRVVRRGPNTPSSRPRRTCADSVGHWSSSELVRNLLQSRWLHPSRITCISPSTRICSGHAIGLLCNSWAQDRLFLCATAFPIQSFLYHQLSAPWNRIPLQSNYERYCP